jgi:signal transduction histidine kinase
MRQRILLLVVGMTTLVVLAFAIPLAILIPNAVAQRADRSAVERADNVALFIRNGGSGMTQLKSYLASLPQTTDQRTSVSLPDGTIVGSPPPNAAPSPPGEGGVPDIGARGPGDQPGGGGPADQAQLVDVPGGRVARATTRVDDMTYLVQVYLSDAAREGGVGGWWAVLGGASTGLIVLAALGGELLTRRIVRPLTRTAQTARRLRAGDVTARAPEDGPREIAEVGISLNQLADRIDELIADERETVADMSHRMRTPITALRLDAESLRDPVERERIGSQVTAVQRTLTAVIRSARRPQREGRMPATDASAVVRDRVAFWSALSDDQERSTTVEVPDTPLLVRTSAEDLAAAVDALLENVVAHTPEGTDYRVLLRPDPVGARLVVSDDGPGLPNGAGQRGHSDRGSSGLGLSIARGCAEASGGSMDVRTSPTSGAEVTLLLGAP